MRSVICVAILFVVAASFNPEDNDRVSDEINAESREVAIDEESPIETRNTAEIDTPEYIEPVERSIDKKVSSDPDPTVDPDDYEVS